MVINYWDWEWVGGEGQLHNGRGGQVKLYPYKKGGGAEKASAMLKGEHQKC